VVSVGRPLRVLAVWKRQKATRRALGPCLLASPKRTCGSHGGASAWPLRNGPSGSCGERDFARGPRGLSVFTSLHSALYFRANRECPLASREADVFSQGLSGPKKAGRRCARASSMLVEEPTY